MKITSCEHNGHSETNLNATLFFLSALLFFTTLPLSTEAKDPLAPLKGRIIINPSTIYVPDNSEDFVRSMLDQHNPVIKPDFNGQYKIHYIAFFKNKPNTKKLFVIVGSKDGEVLQMAEVPIKPDQTTLQSFLIVEGKPKPGKTYKLKVLKVKGKKEKIIAEETVHLKLVAGNGGK
ncbi:MAG: hypothetical protein GXP49_03350 [Deltaproteobacteria bacterium]|nr:hypothetical protein [Deltaproteobacteria bacterium]